MRSYSQFESKIAMGGAAYERNTELPKTMAKGWRNLYQDYKNGLLPGYYESKIDSEEQIKRKVETGEYVIDTYLFDFLKSKEIIRNEYVRKL